MKRFLLFFVFAVTLFGQTVTVEEVLMDSQGSNLAGSLVVSNVPFLYPQGSTLTVSGASNATPIQIDTTAAHGLSTDNTVHIVGVGGNTAANGDWVITFVDSDSFTLNGSAGNGAYTTGGTVQKLVPVGANRVTTTLVSGKVSIALIPSTTAIAIPTGGAAGFTYHVEYFLDNGARYTERWSVAPNPSKQTVSGVRTPGVVSPTATVGLDQLAKDIATDTSWYVGFGGSEWGARRFATEVNAQTGTAYTVLDADLNKLVTFTNAAAVAVTLPQAGVSSQFLAGWRVWFCNVGTVSKITITPTTSTIGGAAVLSLNPGAPPAFGQCAMVISDGTNYLVAGAGHRSGPRSLFTSTAHRTQANTAAEVTIVGTGAGSLTLPTNFHDQAGSSLEVRAAGYYSNTGTPTITFKIKYGSNILGSTGAVTTTTGATDWQWWFDGLATFRTVGASGTVIVQGRLLIQTGTNTISIYPMLQTATVTVNTTVTQAVDLTIQWGTASTSNTISGTNFRMYGATTPQ